MGTHYGVLIDTISIQKYVFGSNKLKENIGASYIVSHVLENIIESKRKSYKAEKGYYGGGNFLLFFNENKRADNFIKELTCTSLHQLPGLKIIAACEKYDENEKFSDFRNRIFEKLNENKRKILIKVTLDSHGINEDCPRTGLSADIYSSEENNYISSVSLAKFSYADEANNELIKIFDNKYKFPTDFSELGHSKHEDSHLAVVHIDGNGFGDLFKTVKTLEETQNLSIALSVAIKNTFEKLLKYIQDNLVIIKENLNIKSDLMPIRPIIMGGDDITFVCDGRLGILFAQKFIEFFETHEIAKSMNLSLCAGVAIVKLKFPFYRAYRLAEDLCSNAKHQRHISEYKGSWIDYHITYSSFSGNIIEIREKDFKVNGVELTMKPYPINSNLLNFNNIINASKKFVRKVDGDKKAFPRNKLKFLREYIIEGGKRTNFTLQYPDLDLPVINDYENEFINNDKTPYLDAIELTELYPFELNKNGKDNINEK